MPKQKPSKNHLFTFLKFSFLTALFVLGFLIIAVIVILLSSDKLREMDTNFPPGFSTESFGSLDGRISKEEVLRRLGEPIAKQKMNEESKDPTYPREYWQ